MKILFLIVAALSFLGLVTYNFENNTVVENSAEMPIENAENQVSKNTGQSPVLVELFTSEGCSSCPPADRNLISMENQPNVIALGFHVDYWNRLGWTDKFSKAEYSQRQSFYSNTFKLGEVYTPQMIVDGTYQFVGGNSGEATTAVNSAQQTAKGEVGLSVSGDKLNVSIMNLPTHSYANVFLAIAENDISTNVKNGENGGKTLNHAAVVRELKVIGGITANASGFHTELVPQISRDWKKPNLKYVVFVQTEDTSKIIAVNQLKF